MLLIKIDIPIINNNFTSTDGKRKIAYSPEELLLRVYSSDINGVLLGQYSMVESCYFTGGGDSPAYKVSTANNNSIFLAEDRKYDLVTILSLDVASYFPIIDGIADSRRFRKLYNLTFDSTGTHYMFIGQEKNANLQSLYIDGVKQKLAFSNIYDITSRPNNDLIYKGVNTETFIIHDEFIWHLVRNDQIISPFPLKAISDIKFFPESGKMVYAANKDKNREFKYNLILIDSEVVASVNDGELSIPEINPINDSFAYTKSYFDTAENKRLKKIIYQDKQSKGYPEIYALKFNNNGTHFGYIAKVAEKDETTEVEVVLDFNKVRRFITPKNSEFKLILEDTRAQYMFRTQDSKEWTYKFLNY